MQSAATANAASGHVALWLSALPIEVEPLLSLLEVTASTQVAGQPCWQGTLRGRKVRAALCGVGGEACERSLGALLDRWPDTRVLLVGLAGALNPALHVGDVVIASQAVSWPAKEVASRRTPLLGATGGASVLNGGLRQDSGAGFRVVTGSVLSWHGLVHDGLLKKRLRASYGADCVDMETGYAVRICKARGVPFLAIRGIADQADNTVDELEPADLAVAVWHAALVAVEAMARPVSSR